MTVKKTLISSTAFRFIRSCSTRLSVPAMAYIIRGLGPIGYGQWTMATALIGTMTILTNLGLRGALHPPGRRRAADGARGAC